MAKISKALDFDEVANLIVSVGASITPSEVHGLLAGQLAAGKRMEKDAWMNEASALLHTESSFNAEQQEQLQFIYRATLSQLSDDQLSFYPLIPDEDLEMEQRLQCLGLWCSGFMAGFALVEKQNPVLPELINDALNDLAAISQVGENEEEELNETAEEDLFQIVEYVRLAAMNIFIEYALTADAKQKADKGSSAVAQAKEGEYLTTNQLFKGRNVH